jgi:transcriptional regulator with XRE-family HTH domain
MTSQAGVRQSARTFELQRRKFALMAAEHVRALGERIRVRREELGMTQDEVARQMSGTVDGQRISKWERGENRPRDESLEDLARVLKTTPEALLAPAAKMETPDLSLPPANGIADRLDAIERALAEQRETLAEQRETLAEARRERAEHVEHIEQLLARQDRILARIEANITAEREAKKETEDATARLLAATAVASQALRGGAPRPAEAHEQPSK